MDALVSPETNLIIQLLLAFSDNHKLTTTDCETIKRMVLDDRKISDWSLPDELKTEIECCSGETVVSVIKLLLINYYLSSGDQSIKTIGLKKESYKLLLPRLRAVFPEAKTIAIVRDPRAVALSKMKSIYTGSGEPFTRSAAKAALQWNEFMRYVEAGKRLYESRFHTIFYEELINRHDESMSSLAQFLGLEIKQKESRYNLHERYSELHSNVQNPPMRGNDNRWESELSKRQIFVIELLCGSRMQETGYRLQFQGGTGGGLPNWLMDGYFVAYLYLRQVFGALDYDRDGIFAIRKK